MDKVDKRVSRYVCLQLLYSLEMSNASQKDIINHFYINSNELYDDLSEKQINYIKKIVDLCKRYKDSIDKLINTKLKNWDMSRLALMDKLILRMAITEMLYVDEVPPKVSITEGVEIAKEFSTKDSSRFVNGILDAVYNNVVKKNIKETG